jgi:RNA:NAD 2'-phosphotransferase (TPT1/KptA family)
VSIPKTTTDTAERSTAAKASASSSSSSRQVTLEPSAKHKPAPPPPSPQAPAATPAGRAILVAKAPAIQAPPPGMPPPPVARRFNWENTMVYADDLLDRYSDFKNKDLMDPRDLTACSKAMSYFLRHGMVKLGVNSQKVAGMEGFYSMETVRKLIDDQKKWLSYTDRLFLYTVARNDGQRFELYVQGPDPSLGHSATKVFVRPAAGQSEVYDEHGLIIKDADRLYCPEMELKVEELPIPGKIYHGTHSALWETIVSTSLIPGGARTGRLMNHFSIFPAGDPRNKAGTREEAQVVIEYDAAGIYEWAKARGFKHKLYMLHNGCVVTQLSVPWQYAMRVFERKTKYNLWRNPRYFKESNKMPLQPQQEVEVYRPPPRELILKGTKGDLDRWNAQFPEHFRRETEAARSRYIKTYGNDEYFTPPYSPPQHLVEEVVRPG